MIIVLMLKGGNMIGWIIIGFFIYLLGICPGIGYLWNRFYNHYYKNIRSISGPSEWIIENFVIGFIITIICGIVIIGIIFIIKGI